MRPSNGFTLLEMLIALAIVAILALAAVPAYLQPMSRVESTQAGACLLELAGQLDRHRLEGEDYAGFAVAGSDAACRLRLSDRYRFEAGVPGEPTWGGMTTDPVAWQLRVRPRATDGQGAQAPGCAALVVRDDGRRGVMADLAGAVQTAADRVRRCWR
ncbi:prepilin-type N-terminal cleavage/methylation domain-containing protein [Spiribacter sp. 1M153]|uniref:prepilin-type N-terminal cleavage/methylation domain-containing protein n=1 Tax=Spiribacter roseus TaxID=1855875 RepID=UPI00349FA095